MSSRRTVLVLLLATVLLLVGALSVSQPGGVSRPGDVSAPADASDPSPVLFEDGFESGGLSAWSDGSGLTLERGDVADGAWAARAATAAAPAWAAAELPMPAADVVLQADVRATSVGSQPMALISARTASGTPVAELSAGAAGGLWLTAGPSGVAIAVPTSLTRDWHTVALRVHVGSPGGRLAVELDGAEVQSWRTDLGTDPVGQVRIGDDRGGNGSRGEVLIDSVSARTGPSHVAGPPAPSTDPVLAAAGDIACDPGSSSFHDGAGSSTACRMRAVADLVLAEDSVDVVAALGDVQYYCGGAEAFRRSYDPSWGRFRDLTRPAVGNHEYLGSGEDEDVGEDDGKTGTDCGRTGSADGYFGYFGARAGAPDEGYYSYDLGSWHVVVLNTTCRAAGGCHAGSAQERWLRDDLVRHPARCTLAYFHIPVWSSGGRADDNAVAMTQDLVAAGVDVLLTGHDHIYERFAPQDARGRPDPRGIRSWVVGTGGANHTRPAQVARNSEVLDARTFGVLRLVLREGRYDWSFVPEPGSSFTDAGSASCV